MSKTLRELVRFLPGSDQTLMVYFGEEISLEGHARVVRFLRLLEREPLEGVRNLHPGYCSVMVKFNALRWTHAELEGVLREYLARSAGLELPAPREVEIPVCYGGEFGPDLGDVCAANGVTTERAIQMHRGAEYLVYFLGFVPGFAYLGRVERGAGARTEAKTAGRKNSPAALRMARLAVPRKLVPAGSVGIADAQTGVYPFATPGGWRLIGRTPLKMFRGETGESLLEIGDRVRFAAISPERFAELEHAR